MTWSLNAAGHTPAPAAEPGQESPGWADVEQELFDELATVLAKPKYGCGTSSFSGNHVSGTLHLHHDVQIEHIRESIPDRVQALHPVTAAILKHFAYGHLPEPLAAVSKKFHDLAHAMAGEFDGPELTTGLRKLLEAKDCCVRAALEDQPG